MFWYIRQSNRNGSENPKRGYFGARAMSELIFLISEAKPHHEKEDMPT